MNILVSGGAGRLATHLSSAGRERGHQMLLRSRQEMDITEPGTVERELSRTSVDLLIHAAAALDPEDANALVRTNIIGTALIVAACRKHNIKLVYISTDHVYPASRSDHRESDPVLPFTSYGWSKLGGECAVRTYPGSLIVRGAFCPTPYPHAQAYSDVTKNLVYQDAAAGLILDNLDLEGVLNIGAPEPETLLSFARRTRPDVEETTSPETYQPKRGVIATARLHGMKPTSPKSKG